MPRRSSPLRRLLLSATLLAVTPAHAAPSEADRVAARTLLIEGRKKLEAGDAKGALEFFEKAHALMHVPTTGLDRAKALATLGKLVEAREAALEVKQMPAKPGEPEAFAAARQEAAEAVGALDQRIPSLVLRISGVSRDALKATVDGVSIPSAELGAARQMNPGAHEIVVTAPGAPTWKQTVTLLDGQPAPVELQIELAPLQKAKPEPEPPVTPGSASPSWRNAAIWSGAGLAVVGVGLGVGFSAAAAGKNGAVEDERARLKHSTVQGQRICAGLEDPRCATLVGLAEERDTYRNVAIAGYVAGGLATAGAVTLLLMKKTPAKGDQKPAAAVLVVPSLGGLAVTGTF
jgi:hypothetical protein